jgi:hypothetical protein
VGGQLEVKKRQWQAHRFTLGASFQANSRREFASYDVASRTITCDSFAEAVRSSYGGEIAGYRTNSDRARIQQQL